MSDDDLINDLTEWSARLAAELGLSEFAVDIDALLGLASIAAHEVRRPAAPVTTFVVGYAAGRAAAAGIDPMVAASAAAATAARLAAQWNPEHTAGVADPSAADPDPDPAAGRAP